MNATTEGEISEMSEVESEQIDSDGLKDVEPSDAEVSENSRVKTQEDEEEGEEAVEELDGEVSSAEDANTFHAGRDLKSICVLFVEDDEDTATLVAESIKPLGIENIVRVATAGAAYFQLTNDKDLFPDLILLELVLPGMSGIQFLAKIRSDPDLRIRTLPVVVLTEVDSASVYQRVTNQNISAYLRKPVSSGGLHGAIAAALSGKVIEPPLAFGRSWIDEAEDEEDSRSDDDQSSWIKRFFVGLFGGKKKRRRR